MRVVATARGFDNIAIREVGDEFEMPEGSKGEWFEPVEGAVAPKAKAKKGSGRAETMSELAKEQAETLPGDGGSSELA